MHRAIASRCIKAETIFKVIVSEIHTRRINVHAVYCVVVIFAFILIYNNQKPTAPGYALYVVAYRGPPDKVRFLTLDIYTSNVPPICAKVLIF